MKTTGVIFILAVSIIFLSCTRTKKEYWPDGTVKSEIRYKGDNYHGKATWYDEEGDKQLECTYVNNEIDGELIRYFKNGRKQESVFYSMGKKNGKSITYETHGNVIEEINFRNGLKDGPYRQYYSNGKPLVEGSFRNDMFNGEWRYYDEDGNIVGDGNFTDGTGKQRSFYPGGGIRHEVNYKENLKEGPEIEYSPDGKIISKVVYSKNKVLEVEKNSVPDTVRF